MLAKNIVENLCKYVLTYVVECGRIKLVQEGLPSIMKGGIEMECYRYSVISGIDHMYIVTTFKYKKGDLVEDFKGRKWLVEYSLN